MTSSKALLEFTLSPKVSSRTVYTRRMYAIIRKYTPDVVEGKANQCFADITGMRTFLKMSYSEIAQRIQKDLAKELGHSFVLRIATQKSFNEALIHTKKTGSVSTYKEMNTLFRGISLVDNNSRPRTVSGKKMRLSVPFIGKVS